MRPFLLPKAPAYLPLYLFASRDTGWLDVAHFPCNQNADKQQD